MAVSQNGYVANDISRTQVWEIPGTDRRIRLRMGSPGALLVRLAAWFDKNIEDIEAGELDDWGYAERPIRGSTTTLSNHASGTAMDLNSTKHPLGVRGTFRADQMIKIRAELKKYGGCIRWGGDYVNRPDEMHFEIVEDVATCDQVLARLSKATDVEAPPKEDEMTPAQMQELKDFIEARTQAYAVANNNYVRQVLSTATKAIVAEINEVDDEAAAAVAAKLQPQFDELAKKTIQDAAL